MKSAGERHWVKMSTHGKKEFLSHNGLDKKIAVSTWSALQDDVKKKFEINPIVKHESETVQ